MIAPAPPPPSARQRPQTAGRRRPSSGGAPLPSPEPVFSSGAGSDDGSYTAMREQQLLKQAIRNDEEVAQLKAQLVDLRSKKADGDTDRTTDVAVAEVTSPERRRRGRTVHDTFQVAPVVAPAGSSEPFCMESHSMDACNGKLWLVGGTSGSHLNPDTWVYTLQQRRWRKARATGNTPLGRYGHASVVYRGKLYVHGGYGLGGITAREQQPNGHKGDLRAQVKSVTDPALWHSADQGYQMIRCGLLNSLYCLDLESLVWSELQGPDREYLKNHSAVVHKGRIFYFGGCMLEGRTNVVRVFDCETKRWLPLDYYNSQLGDHSAAGEMAVHNADVPTVRSGHSACLLPGSDLPPSMVVFGGRMSKYAYCNDTFSYRTDTRKWEKLYCGGDLPEARSAHSAAAWRNFIIVTGGHAYEGTDSSPRREAGSAASPRRDQKQYFADCFVLDVVEGMWREVSLTGSAIPRGRCGHSAVLFEDVDRGVVMATFGGWGDVPLDARHLNDEDTMYQANSGSAYATNNEMWVWSVAPPAPPSARPVHRKEPPLPRVATVTPSSRPGSRGRPMSAPSSGRRRRGGSPSPRPWCVATSKATTAREFGELPLPVALQPRRDYSEQEVDNIVSRLSDAAVRDRDRQRAELMKRYLNPPGATPVPPRMTPGRQRRFVQRHYNQVPELQAHLRRELESKYAKQAEPTRLQGAVIEEMVERLHRPASPPLPPEREHRQVSRGQINETVHRLFTLGVQSSKERHSQLRSKYCPTGPVLRVPDKELRGIIDRLFAGEKQLGT